MPKARRHPAKNPTAAESYHITAPSVAANYTIPTVLPSSSVPTPRDYIAKAAMSAKYAKVEEADEIEDRVYTAWWSSLGGSGRLIAGIQVYKQLSSSLLSFGESFVIGLIWDCAL